MTCLGFSWVSFTHFLHDYGLLCVLNPNYSLCWQVEEICGMETALFQFCKFIAPVQGFNFQGQYIETNCNNLISESFSFPISIQP